MRLSAARCRFRAANAPGPTAQGRACRTPAAGVQAKVVQAQCGTAMSALSKCHHSAEASGWGLLTIPEMAKLTKNEYYFQSAKAPVVCSGMPRDLPIKMPSQCIFI